MKACKVSAKNSNQCAAHRGGELGPDGFCQHWHEAHGLRRPAGPMPAPTRLVRFRLRAVDARRVRRFLEALPESWPALLRQTLGPYLERPETDPGRTAGGALGCRWTAAPVPLELFARVWALCNESEELLERHIVAAFERAWKVTPTRRL